MILRKNQYPKVLKHPSVKGISVGKCVNSSSPLGSTGKFKTHKGIIAAHSHSGGSHPGWICFLNRKYLSKQWLCLHELAHLISPVKSHHDKYWRNNLLKLIKQYKASTKFHKIYL